MAKPTQDITWAKGTSPNTQNPTNERSNGYPEGFQPPAAAHNWQFEAIGDYITHLMAVATTGFASGAAALAAGLTDGDGFWWRSNETASLAGRWGDPLANSLALFGAVGWVDIDHDGEFLIALEQDVAATTQPHITVHDPTGTTAERDFVVGTTTLGANATAVACNGTYIAVAFNDAVGAVYVYDYDGVEKFNFTHGAFAADVCMDESRVYVCGANGTTSYDVRAYDLVAETETWGYDHAATLYSIATDGESVYVGGDVSGGNHIRQLNAVTGTLVQSLGTTDPIEARNRIVIGEYYVFVLTQNAGTGTLQQVRKDLGTVVVTQGLGAGFAGVAGLEGLAVDDRFVHVGGGTVAGLTSFVLDDITLDRTHILSTTAGDTLVSSGHDLWSVSTTLDLRIDLGRRAGFWRYASVPGKRGRWFQRKFIPAG